MTHPDKLFGRLGNRMFQMAALYADSKNWNIDIYYQNEGYFKSYEAEIRELYGEGIGYLPTVSIHVRRGDYVGSTFHVDLTKTDYYERAIEMFPNEHFVVFSDDPAWCKEKWGNDPRFQIIEGNDEVTDMNLMASCKHNIIANSTFSWWAAWLNPNPGKTVVCPFEWFYDGVERISLPKTWKKI